MSRREGFGNVVADSTRAVEKRALPDRGAEVPDGGQGADAERSARRADPEGVRARARRRDARHGSPAQPRHARDQRAHQRRSRRSRSGSTAGRSARRRTATSNKERAVRVCENTYAVGDSVGMCRFTTKLFNSPSLPGLEEFANQIGNVTGLQFADAELERDRPQHHGRRAADQRPRRRHAASTTRCRTAGSTSRSPSASTPARRSTAPNSTGCCRASTRSRDLDAQGQPAGEWRGSSRRGRERRSG